MKHNNRKYKRDLIMSDKINYVKKLKKFNVWNSSRFFFNKVFHFENQFLVQMLL